MRNRRKLLRRDHGQLFGARGVWRGVEGSEPYGLLPPDTIAESGIPATQETRFGSRKIVPPMCPNDCVPLGNTATYGATLRGIFAKRSD
jgi:hypothetical protein